jgi:hypothetical protein
MSIRNNTIASIGFRPAMLLRSASGVNTGASMSPRKLSHGTSRAMASSGSPFAESVASRLSVSKKLSCLIPSLQESCHAAKQQTRTGSRGALDLMLIFGEQHLRNVLKATLLIRNHHYHANSIRIASLLGADMIFGRDRICADAGLRPLRVTKRTVNPFGKRRQTRA